MTAARSFPIPQMQASYHVDADLAGQTGRYSQEGFMSFLGDDIINFASHKHSRISTGTHESEVKAICNLSKAEVVANYKLLEPWALSNSHPRSMKIILLW